MNWELVKNDGDVYYDLWNKFWGKPLDFEPDTTVGSVGNDEDDEESMVVEKSFKVLMISARLKNLSSTKGRLIVRQEYLDAVVPLNERFEKRPYTGAVVIGHPGIGERLHDKLYRWSQQLSRAIFVSLLSSSLTSLGGKENNLEPRPGRRNSPFRFKWLLQISRA